MFLQKKQLYNYKTEGDWQTHRLFRPEVSWPYPEPFWKAGLAPPLWPPREPPRVNTGGGIWPPRGSLKRGAFWSLHTYFQTIIFYIPLFVLFYVHFSLPPPFPSPPIEKGKMMLKLIGVKFSIEMQILARSYPHGITRIKVRKS
jgi:hypothetical protein